MRPGEAFVASCFISAGSCDSISAMVSMRSASPSPDRAILAVADPGTGSSHSGMRAAKRSAAGSIVSASTERSRQSAAGVEPLWREFAAAL
jgi:hypothetical protein